MGMKFIIKLIVNGIVVVPLLMWFSQATFFQAVCTAVVLCIIAFLIGDQWILRTSNNTVATIADAVLALVFLWLVAAFMNWDLSFTEILVISLVLGVVEAIFHRFLGHDDRVTA
jgi:membrane protein HdeD